MARDIAVTDHAHPAAAFGLGLAARLHHARFFTGNAGVVEDVRVEVAVAGVEDVGDPQAGALRTALADYHHVRPEQVFVGNGSDEVLAHAFFAFFQQDAPQIERLHVLNDFAAVANAMPHLDADERMQIVPLLAVELKHKGGWAIESIEPISIREVRAEQRQIFGEALDHALVTVPKRDQPGRGQHDALDALYVGIVRKKVNWVLDLDVRSFFDKVDHDWMIRFVEHRIGDRRIVRLIQKWLKAGVMEQERWIETEEGTPQGSVISPVLANLYLHYVLDLWVDQWRRKKATGDVIIVRYADDAVLGFQLRSEAERFLQEVQERMGKFGLELHPEKTRLIEFGRYAAERRKQRGEGCPETFNFLGLTHICGTNRKTGYFTIIRQTISKRRAAKLKQLNAELRQRLHDPLAVTAKWLQSVVRGYFQYHAVPGNEKSLGQFRSHILRLWLRQIRRRSQRSCWTWERFLARLGGLLPEVCILHPYPTERFAAKYPR